MATATTAVVAAAITIAVEIDNAVANYCCCNYMVVTCLCGQQQLFIATSVIKRRLCHFYHHLLFYD